MRWNGWKNLEEGMEAPFVFVLNLDIAKSKKTGGVISHCNLETERETETALPRWPWTLI